MDDFPSGDNKGVRGDVFSYFVGFEDARGIINQIDNLKGNNGALTLLGKAIKNCEFIRNINNHPLTKPAYQNLFNCLSDIIFSLNSVRSLLDDHRRFIFLTKENMKRVDFSKGGKASVAFVNSLIASIDRFIEFAQRFCSININKLLEILEKEPKVVLVVKSHYLDLAEHIDALQKSLIYVVGFQVKR